MSAAAELSAIATPFSLILQLLSKELQLMFVGAQFLRVVLLARLHEFLELNGTVLGWSQGS